MSSKRKAKYRLRPNAKKSKGLTLPGYNNLGPFNEINTPLSESDANALLHDIEYTKLGKRAYWTFNQADQDFIEATENAPDYGAKLGNAYFKTKKKLSEWNILPSDPLQSKSKKNPLLEFHGTTGNAPLTRARKKALERQQKITQFMKQKKPNVNREPLSNLQENTQETTMSTAPPDGTGSGREPGLKETQIDRVVDVERGIPRYQFASLPFNAVWYQESANTQNLDYVFRMTSPYDCVVTTLRTDKNPGTGVEQSSEAKVDSLDVVSNKAMWFNFYASMYKYYSVVSCRWSMLIENLGHDPVYVHQMYVNDTNPPVTASNMDILNWNDATSHYVHPAAIFLQNNGVKSTQYNAGFQTESDATTAGTSNYAGTGEHISSRLSNTLQLSGQYTPGQNDHEIRLDADVENWTLCTTNPKLTERLLIRVKPDSAAARIASTPNNYGRTLRIKYTIKLEYLVEFKELDEKLRWPIITQPLTVTIPVSDAIGDGNDPMDEETTS
jgi:hypothetical protein